jgi:hypothetical protein
MRIEVSEHMERAVPRASFPFIVGCGRSGTTLLRAMLDAHPAFAIPGESYFPVWLSRFPYRYGEGNRFARDRFLSDLLAHEYFVNLWRLPPDKVRTAVEEAKPHDFSDAVRAVYALYAQEHGKPRYGDKTPVFVSHVDRLTKLFPEAVFVHLIRDGRDVALSIMDVTWGPNSLEKAALYWRQQVRQGLSAAGPLGPRRYYSLRYEDLLAAPVVELTKLCGFLGVDYSDDMLSYASSASRLLAGLPNPKEHDRLSTAPAPRRNWRHKLSVEDEQVFGLLAGDVLAETGYSACDSRPSRAARIRAGRARAEWEAASVTRRVRSTAARLRDATRSPGALLR